MDSLEKSIDDLFDGVEKILNGVCGFLFGSFDEDDR